MTTKAINKRESRAMHFFAAIRNALVFTVSMFLLVVTIVPLAIAERGHMAFGGEWFLIVGLSVLITLLFAKK